MLSHSAVKPLTVSNSQQHEAEDLSQRASLVLVIHWTISQYVAPQIVDLDSGSFGDKRNHKEWCEYYTKSYSRASYHSPSPLYKPS
jgi:hypothetical protein